MPPNEQESSFPKTPGANQSVTSPVQETRFSSPSHVIPCPDGLSHQSRQSSVLRQSLRPIILKFEELTYSIASQTGKRSYWFGSQEPKPNRFVLNGVSGIVKPGELLAMLGPSGSGKTTLVTALAGRLHGKLSGTVSYNEEPFSSAVKRKTGFVTQEDVLYPHLTVLETLTYTALLRLPKELTRKEKIEQAETVVSDLGLTRCCNSVIGGGLVRGISGGERKRVSIGQEMLVNPSLLLLDEPTSGLDSTTAARIVSTLRTLARGGRTVVMTIHQPSSRLYRMFDKVLVLSEGSPIYSGDSGRVMEYFGSIGFQPGSNFVNPADFVLDLANGWQVSGGPHEKHDSYSSHFSLQMNFKSSRLTDLFVAGLLKMNVKRPAEFLNCPFTEEEEESGSVKEIANLCSLSSLEINKNGTIRVGVDTNVFFRKSELVIGRMIALYKWRKRLKRSLDVRLRGLGLIFQ
ncbi:hypothetical protein F2Q70_00031840 [Brassica cretica]|uniref:ABC transporter domain-containing protein n=1 Tax=Brassica cretica TaxID=69181 RepID=A0A8S9FCW7_BRACR|nr:hypothetical protein F2Q70_00031840 [Brassica cretica]